MAEKRKREELISGGTEWICLALSRRGMDANCRETDERSRAVKRKGIAMSGEETEVIRFDQCRDGVELLGKAQKRSRNAGQRGETAI